MGTTRMKRRDSLLAAARRRRNSLGRFVLAWFAVAWFTLAGAPCLAMANANVDAREHAAEAHAHGHHGHAMSHRRQACYRSVGYPLSRAVCRDELWIGGLKFLQPRNEPIVIVIRDDRRIVDVVSLIVLANRLAKLGDL